MSASCKEKSLVSSKSGAELVLRAILGLPVNPDDVPSQGGLETFETIVAASIVPSRMHIDIEKDE
jgi:DEAD/DEAH box helicase domain-containing protein